ncbi:hypothetical protein IM511_00985 [Erythrobacteraceae bacterium E2-1 Yellow Sea]|nr:hypothetical protein [Erythrobacteraceae bacterium E2-1 Yellow Sea]
MPQGGDDLTGGVSAHPDTALLPAELQIALGYTAPALRPRLESALLLDQRIGRLIGQSSEPMLGQMRIAWWRDMLGKPVAERPRGDAVLDALGLFWAEQEAPLVALVDGWEQLLVEPPLPEESALAFAHGRAAPFLALCEAGDYNVVTSAACVWALTDAGIHISDPAERALFQRLSEQQYSSVKLPRNLRGLAVLRALASRSLANDLAPMMAGRGASLVALRAGLLGR